LGARCNELIFFECSLRNSCGELSKFVRPSYPLYGKRDRPVTSNNNLEFGSKAFLHVSGLQSLSFSSSHALGAPGTSAVTRERWRRVMLSGLASPFPD